MSLLKAWNGDATTKENDYLFERLPGITGKRRHGDHIDHEYTEEAAQDPSL